MKKLLCLAIAGLCVTCMSANAVAGMSWDVGVKGGYNMSKFIGDHVNNVSVYKTGVVGGMFITTHFTDHLAVRVEGLYTQKGAGDTLTVVFPIGDDLCDVGVDITTDLEYFEIPILGVVAIKSWENVRIDGFGGPAFAFKTTAKSKVEIPVVDQNCQETGETVEEEVALGEVVKKADVGGVLGLGLVFKVGPINLDGGVRWTFGISKFRDTLIDKADTKNSAISFTMGIAFRLGR